MGKVNRLLYVRLYVSLFVDRGMDLVIWDIFYFMFKVRFIDVG